MMMEQITPEFVEFIPRNLTNGILYISEKFGTASHLCCCGCGTKIVTPLRPTEYALLVKDGLVSLRPSIGNWNHPCQSHYFITRNKVEWAGRMNPKQIALGRMRDDAMKASHFRNTKPTQRPNFSTRLRSWVRSLWS